MNKEKGKLQVLWERGLWVPGMKLPQSQKKIDECRTTGKELLSDRLNVNAVLMSCPDFFYEPHILRKEIEDRGHVLLESVICSPEFAGGGNEYGWGKLKYEQRQRKENSDRLESGEVFKCKIRDLCLDKTVLTMERVWKFQRRARDYIRLYLNCRREGPTSISFNEIEKLRKRAKSHRNVGEGANAQFKLHA